MRRLIKGRTLVEDAWHYTGLDEGDPVGPQALPLQLYGAHDCVVAGLHAPAPSQLRARVAVVAPAGQDAEAHSVPAA